MATTWTNISSTTYTGASGDGVFKVLVQYDKTTATATKMTIKIKASLVSGWSTSSYAANGYYILYNPGTDSEKLFTLKAPGDRWSSSVETTLTITKAYTVANFTIPAFWICNTGSVKPDLSARSIVYSDYSGSMYNLFKSTGKRQGYVTYATSSTQAGIKTLPGGAPTVSVVDKGNNTVLISGKVGKVNDETHNDIKSATLFYTLDGTDPKTSTTGTAVKLDAELGDSLYSKTIALTADRTVRAYIVCEFVYNTTEASGKVAALYYAPPGNPGVPTLTAASFKNNRLTTKQNWTYTWTAAAAGNKNSPVIGYRIRLYKNGVNVPIKNVTGTTTLSKLLTGSTTDYIYDTESTATSFTINPVFNNFSAPGTVKMTIFAYAKNKAGDKLWSGGGKIPVESAVTSVQNAGIVNVKTPEGWREGQVFVKTSTDWVEAESVHVKTPDGWKESQ